jgi:hypothetical protein
VEHVRVSGRCFSGCPFIVSHGTVQQSIGLVQGYTFPEALFAAVADFVAERPNEIITLLLLASHGARRGSIARCFLQHTLTDHRLLPA